MLLKIFISIRIGIVIVFKKFLISKNLDNNQRGIKMFDLIAADACYISPYLLVPEYCSQFTMGVNITNYTNTVSLTKTLTLSVLDCLLCCSAVTVDSSLYRSCCNDSSFGDKSKSSNDRFKLMKWVKHLQILKSYLLRILQIYLRDVNHGRII